MVWKHHFRRNSSHIYSLNVIQSIFEPGESKITKYRIETAVAAEKQVVAISIDELTEDLIITFEDKIARIAVEDLESFRKRLGRQIIKDKCGFQIAPNNMEKFKDFQIINLDREAQLTPLGKVLRRKSRWISYYLWHRVVSLNFRPRTSKVNAIIGENENGVILMKNGLFGIDTIGEMVELISNKDLNDSSKGRTSRILIGQASSSDFPYVAIEKERIFIFES